MRESVFLVQGPILFFLYIVLHIIHLVLGRYFHPSKECTIHRVVGTLNLCIIHQVFGPLSGLLSSKLVYNSPSLGLVLLSFKYVYNSPNGRDSNYVNLCIIHRVLGRYSYPSNMCTIHRVVGTLIM